MVHVTSREFAEFIRSRCTAQKVTVGPLVAAGSDYYTFDVSDTEAVTVLVKERSSYFGDTAYTFDVSDAVSGRSAEVTVLVRGRSE